MTTLATDDFNRADSTGLGANWTTITGKTSLNILTNAAVSTAGGNDGNYYNAVAWPNDQWSQATLVDRAAGRNAVKVRVAAAAETYYAGGSDVTDFGNQQQRLWKTVAGVRTSLATNATLLIATDLVYVEARGTTIKLFINGVEVLSAIDSDIASGNAGIGFGDAVAGGGDWDGWSGGDFGGATRPVKMAGEWRGFAGNSGGFAG